MTDNPIAVWQVSGETYNEMFNEADRDAKLFMSELPLDWYLTVINCQPLRKWDNVGNEIGKHVEDGKITMWEGLAIISWVADT